MLFLVALYTFKLIEIYFFALNFHKMLMPFAEQKEYIPFPHMVEGIFYCLGSVGYLDIFARSAFLFPLEFLFL